MKKFKLFKPFEPFIATQASRVKDFINFTWKILRDENNNAILQNKGRFDGVTTLFSGQGVKLNGVDQSIPLDTASVTHTIYTFNGSMVYLNSSLDVSSIIPTGIYQNIIWLNTDLTQAEKNAYINSPETFLYKDKFGNIKSDFGLDVAKVDFYLPLCEKDDYVRDLIEYSENIVLEDDNTVNLPLANNIYIYDNIITTHNQYYLISLDNLDNQVGVKCGSGSYFNTVNGSVIVYADNINEDRVIVRAISDNTNYDGVTVKQLSGIYPINNYTTAVRTEAQALSYGLQTAKIKRDTLGNYVSKSEFLECDGVSTATIPYFESRTVNIELIVNPSELVGNILSGGIALDTTGLSTNQDNTIVLENQTVTSEIVIGNGFKGTIKQYKEILA